MVFFCRNIVAQSDALNILIKWLTETNLIENVTKKMLLNVGLANKIERITEITS